MKMWSVLVEDLQRCAVTGSTQVEIHHVFNGPNRSLSEKYGFLIPLRPDWHNFQPYSIHMDQKFDESWKQYAQRYYEEHIDSRADFMREFGRSYL